MLTVPEIAVSTQLAAIQHGNEATLRQAVEVVEQLCSCYCRGECVTNLAELTDRAVAMAESLDELAKRLELGDGKRPPGCVTRSYGGPVRRWSTRPGPRWFGSKRNGTGCFSDPRERPMAKAPPSFDLYPGDLIKSCEDMDAETFGAYFRLLCYQWEHGYVCKNHMVSSGDNHMVTKNSETARIKRIARVESAHWPEIWEQIKDRFEPIGRSGCLGHKRLATQRVAAIKLWEKRRKNGAMGGRPKKKPCGSLQKTICPPITEEGRNKNKKKEGMELQLSRIPESLRPAVDEWLGYKAERGEQYKPRGLAAFVGHMLTRIPVLGESGIKKRIENSIRRSWQDWDYEPSDKSTEAKPYKRYVDPETKYQLWFASQRKKGVEFENESQAREQYAKETFRDNDVGLREVRP